MRFAFSFSSLATFPTALFHHRRDHPQAGHASEAAALMLC